MSNVLARIYCTEWGYGRLLFPWFGGWVALGRCMRCRQLRLRFVPVGTWSLRDE